MTDKERIKVAKERYSEGMTVRCAFDRENYVLRKGFKITPEPGGDLTANAGDVYLYDSEADKWAEVISYPQTEPQPDEKLIRRFPSGAVRSNNAGRPRPDWVSPYAIEAISMRMVGNVSDFGAANYLLGIPEEDCLESLVRHVEELKEAILITKDPAAIKDLAGAVGFNATALLHTIILKEKGLYKEVYPETQVLPVSEAKKDLTYVKK